jgi:hypothetical protein
MGIPKNIELNLNFDSKEIHLSIYCLNSNFAISVEMPYEEIYLQRLKEENPEEYTKIEENETTS